MRLLLDQGLPRSASRLLKEAGLDTVHTSEIGLAEAEDADILQAAASMDRVVVTLDADFHAMIALTRATGPSVIRIRIERLRGEALARLVKEVVSQCREELRHGALVSVEPWRVRVRRLPLIE